LVGVDEADIDIFEEAERERRIDEIVNNEALL